MDDWDLLEQFRQARSERAFGELTSRHAGFVLGICRRRLRDPHGAEDAAQAVFLVLARRPPARGSGSGALAGWLYKTAVYACNNAMRAKRARVTHERSAAAERVRRAATAATTTTGDPRDRSEDDEVLLDRALAELSSKERDAVLLRYYQDKSVQQVGAALGISQNTASKRITRAVDRMRRFLAVKGLAITSPALVDSIASTMRDPAASGEFIAQAVSIGTGQSAASAGVRQLAEGVDLVIRIEKLKLVACAVVVVFTACGGIVGMNHLMAQDAKPPAVGPARSVKQPATQATQPAEASDQDFDPSTPKGALRAFARATRGADFERLARVSKADAGDDLETQLIAAANDYQKAMGELFSAVRDKFGDSELRKFARQRGAIPLEPFLRLIEAELDEHDAVVQGETATLVDRRDPTTETNVKLVREDGVWKVASTGLVAHFGIERITQRLEMLRARAEILIEVAADVAADKYENIEAVGEGLREALRR
jgi:RNA polymerase sigma factor (sigma-70 family)